jgi:predicted acyl esterase
MTSGARPGPGSEEAPVLAPLSVLVGSALLVVAQLYPQETVLAGSSMPYREWLTSTDAEDPFWQPMRLGQALDRVNVPVLLQEG